MLTLEYYSLMTEISKCIFCIASANNDGNIIVQNDTAFAQWDKYPVNPGHAEIISFRHVESYFDLTENEIIAIHNLASMTKKIIQRKFNPDSYTIGINDGPAAGQTIPHHHMHIIPRYLGDVPQPRGGVRHIIPERGDYP